MGHAFHAEAVLVRGVVLPAEAHLQRRIVGAFQIRRRVGHRRNHRQRKGLFSGQPGIVGDGQRDGSIAGGCIHMGDVRPGVIADTAVPEVPVVGGNRTIRIIAVGSGKLDRISRSDFRCDPLGYGSGSQIAGIFIGPDIWRSVDDPIGADHIRPVRERLIHRNRCILLNHQRAPDNIRSFRILTG